MKMPRLLHLLLSACAICGVLNAASARTAATATGLVSPLTVANQEVDPTDLEEEDNGSKSHPFRIKRQHAASANPLSGLISSVANKKLGLIGSLSSISSSSKGVGVQTDNHAFEYSPPPPAKPFDWTSFKQSILASLLQAAKAITGGLIALSGQLVKVKGHIMAAKGHMLSAKGDSITTFGKHVATNAFADSHHVVGPSAPSGSGSGFGLTGPASFHSSLDPTYPHNDFKAAIEYPSGYHKKSSVYS